ncbi:hypothetical protein GOA99_20340 [Sinorhizobium meliloti]|nr:hypothetical protein [Sinorhizobium meliloti]
MTRYPQLSCPAITPLEEGLHAVGSGLSVREYAAKVGKAANAIQRRMEAAAVINARTDISTPSLAPYWSVLSEFHVVKPWLWPELVAALLATRNIVLP